MAVLTQSSPAAPKLHDVVNDLPHPSLADHAKAGLPLNIPWMRSSMLLGAGLDSDKLTTASPWTSVSAFDFLGRDGKWLVYDGKVDGHASFRNSESTTHESTSDHYSGSLGVTVSSVFLKASVTGSYDRTVNMTSDVCFST
jgi:hypothetical protein